MTAQLEDIPSLDSLLAAAKDLFRQRFGRDATAGAAAPGRVNLIGDYACLYHSLGDLNIHSEMMIINHSKT